MADWRSSMTQTFEYYIVDPNTWKDVSRIDTVKTCSISRDADAETLGSANIDVDESLGECYIRAYLITIQNGMREKHPLATFLVQTPSSKFDGKIRTVSMECYTPLLELKETQPPLGYFVAKTQNVMDAVYQLTCENLRAPVVPNTNATNLFDDFVSEPSDTWLTFISDLAAYAKYEFALDELGRILFAPKQDTASLQPVWTYDDSNSSILHPGIELDHDLYQVPNVVEVVYSTNSGNFYARAANDDPNSPISTVNRGREIRYRETNPSLIGNPTDAQINRYAEQLLRNLSTLEYTITYTHGYCPVRIGDCVRLDYTRAGLNNIKAKVVSQSIKCEPGCPVTEKAIFTHKLWR